MIKITNEMKNRIRKSLQGKKGFCPKCGTDNVIILRGVNSNGKTACWDCIKCGKVENHLGWSI